jgi:hypothetical protein
MDSRPIAASVPRQCQVCFMEVFHFEDQRSCLHDFKIDIFLLSTMQRGNKDDLVARLDLVFWSAAQFPISVVHKDKNSRANSTALHKHFWSLLHHIVLCAGKDSHVQVESQVTCMH